jgi:transposase-like protein
MAKELASAKEAARRLGVSVTSFYDWLRQSDEGTLVIRGQSATIDYLQGGPRGQGRIKLEVGAIERIKELMRVRPALSRPRTSPIRGTIYPGITVPLGRPQR